MVPATADWDVFVDVGAINDRVAQFADRAKLDPIKYVSPGSGLGYSDDIEAVRADLERARALEMNAYRFSVEWNRLQPDPPANREAVPALAAGPLSDYLSVVREVVTRGMTPVISLNHMSLPAWALTPPVATRLIDPFSQLPVAAEDDGFTASWRGWENDETVQAWGLFVTAFASAVHAEFADRTVLWLTLNEPIGSMVGAGYLGAIWSPGFGAEADRGRRICLGLVKAHIEAHRCLKEVAPDYQVGLAHAMLHATPTSFSSPGAGALAGAAVGGGVGASVGAAAGAGVGLIIGAVLCGLLGLLALLCLVLAVIAGAVAGAAVGGAVGAGLGAAIGAIVAGAANVQQEARDQFDYFYNEWILRALVRGEIDTTLMQGKVNTAAQWDRIWREQLGEQAGDRGSRLDFIGINYYRRVHVYWFPLSTLFVPYTGGLFRNNLENDPEPHGILNELGWETYPAGLSSFLRRLHADYGLPILITENGLPEALDANRAPNLIAHLHEVEDALGDPDPPRVIGYLHWTLVDNWEWHEGYAARARFGLYTTGDRQQAATVAHGAARTFRRQLGEAGLALRSIVANRTVGPARKCLGDISARGERTHPGTQSNGVVWEGSIGAEAVKLFLDTTAAGAQAGLIYYRAENAWVGLGRVVWDAAASRLTLAHREALSLPRVPGLDADLILDPASDALNGTGSRGKAAAIPFNATRTRIHGLWLPAQGGDWLALAFHVLHDQGPVGKRLRVGDGERWHAFAVGSQNATFEVDGTAFTAVLGPGARDMAVEGGGLHAEFHRAPSSLVIVGDG